MADISDVEAALCELIESAAYPNGVAQPSVSDVMVKIYRGWPTNRALNADLASGYQTVTVFSKENSTKDTSRYPRVWRTVSQTAPSLTINVVGDTAVVGGTGGAGQIAGITVNGVAYSYPVAQQDTPTSVVSAFARLIPGATPSGTTLIVTGSRLTGLVVGSGTALMETRRQEQGIMIAIWCPTPEGRDLIASKIDNALSDIDWFPLSDGTVARLQYKDTFETDASENANLYRRNLDYIVEYPTTLQMTGS